MKPNYLPWLDRGGRVSWLKLIVFVGLFLPGLWVALELREGWLQPKPVTEAIHAIGQWTVRFLLLSLLVSTLRRVGQWGKLIAVRRMLGIAALAYALIHLSLYVVDQHFDLARVASEIVLRFYLTIGFVALLGLLALGSTSTDAMIRRLGGKRWNRLHSLVYAIAVLALVHFLLQSKIDVTEPVIMVGLFLVLMGQRLLQRFDVGDAVLPLAGLAVGSTVLTALIEAIWYRLRNGIPFDQVLGADFDFGSPLRPAWWVLAAGLALLGVRLLRGFWSRKPARQPDRFAGSSALRFSGDG